MKNLTISNHGASPSNQQAITQTNPCNKALKRKRNDDDYAGQCYLRTRMSPTMLMKLINSDLSEKQVSDIKDMGFGGLLTLKTDKVPGALGHWLVSRFNSVSCSYMKGQFHITDEDIHLSTGIPIGGNEVQIASLNDKSEEFVELKSRWMKQFDKDLTKVETKDILSLLIRQKEGGEEFKRNFIVFVVSVFLMGVKGSHASLRVLKCLRDVSSIQTLNWCQFTRKQFIESVDSWRISKNDSFGGPIMVFVFCYLDRVCYKFFSVARVFPTLATWTKQNITERLKNEMKDGFGTGGVLPRIVKGTVEEVSFNVISDPSFNVPSAVPESSNQQKQKSGEEPKASETDSKQRIAIKELAESAAILADSYARFTNSLEGAKVIRPDCKIVQQLAEMAEALGACCPSSKPTDTTNCDVKDKPLNSPDNKADDTEKDKEKEGVSNTDEHDSEKSNPWSKLNEQSFESEDELWAALVKLETALGKRPANVESNVMKKGKSPILVDSKASSLKFPKSTSPIFVDSQSQEELFEPLNVEKTAQASTSFRRSPRFTHQSPPAFRPPSCPLPDPFTPPSFKLLSSESQEDVFQKGCDDALKIGDENVESNVLKKAKSPNIVDSKAPSPKFPKSTSPIFVDSQSQEEFFQPLNFEKTAQASTSFRRSPRFTHHSPPVFTPPSCPLPDSFTPPSFKLLSSESQEDVFQKMADDALKFCDDALNVNVNVEPLEVEPLSSLPPKEPAHIKMTRAKRSRVQTEAFRSPFLQRSIRLDGKMNKIEREVLDYVFSEFSDESEILFKTGTDLSVTRGDLKTLVSGDRVPKQVIHAWCCILNKGETIRAHTSPSRLYLPQSAELSSQIDDNFTGAALIFVPIISEKPFAMCFNFLIKKLEILHLMRPESINYAPSIESTKEFVIRCLVDKMPSIVDVRDMKLEEIILRSNLGNGTDSGIYLMRLLEKYKGARRTCVLGLQDNNQVKLFGTRACYEMLSFDGNHLKDKVLNDAGSFSLDIRHEVSNQDFQNPKKTRGATKIRQQQRKLTDTEILGLVINNCNDVNYLDEILVATEWMNVCQTAMKSLQNCHWIRDTVIDMFGVMCTYNRPDILYLPSTVQYAKPQLKVNEVNFVWCPHLKMHYKPQDGATIEKVFFTIGKDNKHWLACVSDLKKETNYILDSLRTYRKNDKKALEAYNTYVEDIIVNVSNQIPSSNGYKRLKGISLFRTENVDVPQQANTFDCGVYVMKFLEGAMNNTDLWTDKKHYKDLVAYRRQIILRLIKWEKNTAKAICQDG